MDKQTALNIAEQTLTQALLDGLWLENLYGIREHSLFIPEESAGRSGRRTKSSTKSLKAEAGWLVVAIDSTQQLCFCVKKYRAWQPFEVQKDGILLLQAESDSSQLKLVLSAEQGDQLSLLAAVQVLHRASWWQSQDRDELMVQELDSSIDFYSWLLTQSSERVNTAFDEASQQLGVYQRLILWEQLASLGDRPCFVLSYSKEGWTRDELEKYSCLALSPFELDWLMMPKRYGICQKQGFDRSTFENLFKASPDAISEIKDLLNKQQYDDEEHFLLPVHPIQRERLMASKSVLSQLVEEHGQWLTLPKLACLPLSSQRTVILSRYPEHHLKLSLSLPALGAIRTLPPRYQMNAIKAQKLLQQLQHRDRWFGKYLHLCDETVWEVVSPNRQDLEQESGTLGAVLRTFPESLAQDQDLEIVPMAALGLLMDGNSAPGWRLWMEKDAIACRADKQGRQQWILAQFSRLANFVVQLGVRFLLYGVMPELHGQNMLLVVREGKIRGFILRDLDTLRICPEQIKVHKMKDPEYLINPSTPNTLVLESPDKLWHYFLTLVIEVNLYACIRAIVKSQDIQENCCWQILKDAFEAQLGFLNGHVELKRLVTHYIYSDQWPFKEVMGPYLKQTSLGTGMPSGMGVIENPLNV